MEFRPLLRATLLTLTIATAGATAEVVGGTADIAGTTVRYRVVLPANFDPAKAYPGVLAFPPGAQTMELVDGLIYWSIRRQAERRGFIVFIPAAPDGLAFYKGGEKVFPDLLTKLLTDYKIQDNKFHIAGMSAGGYSAFLIASQHPQYFVSVTGFPGYLRDTTEAGVNALAKMCINMYVGENDTRWVESMDAQFKQFQAKGYNAKFGIEKGQGHVMRSLEQNGAARLFDNFEACSAR